MSESHGIKVTKVGKGISSSDIRDFILHSEYPMFKIDQVLSGSITINAGVQTGYVDITHNLGKRAFLIYQDGELFPSDCQSYNDGTKIRILRDLGAPYNLDTYSWSAPNDLYDDRFGGRSYTVTGHKDGNGRNHAIRFDGIYINQGSTIVSASLDHYAKYRWVTTPALDMKLKTYGIDEDNTGSFDSNPMGRSQTSAVTTQNQVVVNTGEFIGTNVKDQVQEIINRGGWSSGNNLGFLVFDDNGPDGNAIEDDSGRHKLNITVNGGGSITSNYKVVVFKDKIAT